MKTLKEELSTMFREYVPSYPGHEVLADRAVELFMDWLVKKLPESVANVIKTLGDTK